MVTDVCTISINKPLQSFFLVTNPSASLAPDWQISSIWKLKNLFKIITVSESSLVFCCCFLATLSKDNKAKEACHQSPGRVCLRMHLYVQVLSGVQSTLPKTSRDNLVISPSYGFVQIHSQMHHQSHHLLELTYLEEHCFCQGHL